MAIESTRPGDITAFDIPNGVSNAFDADAFDEAIAAHGIKFVHYRAMRNPVGMVDRFDSRRPGDDSESSNGMIYTEGGCVSALFTGNSKDIRAMEGGMLNAGVAQVTFRRCYDDGDDFYCAPMDRLYLAQKSILVTHHQLVNAHPTGRDRLQYPATKIIDLVDSQGKSYSKQDYSLQSGSIVWSQGLCPKVYAVRYLYQPYWYIDRLLHEVRVAQQELVDGSRSVIRMPQAALVAREYIFQGSENDPNNKDLRQVAAPSSGGFGPR